VRADRRDEPKPELASPLRSRNDPEREQHRDRGHDRHRVSAQETERAVSRDERSIAELAGIEEEVTVAGDEQDALWIFDATDLARGPLCKLSHPELDFPFTLHSTWMPSLEAHKPGYKLDRAEDYAARLRDLTQDKRKLAEDALELD